VETAEAYGVIRLVVTRGHAYTHDAVRADRRAPPLEIVDYDRLLASRSLPREQYVFGDLDRLGPFDLELAALVYRRLSREGVRVLNDPARAMTRFALLRALHEAGINRFNAYRVDERMRPARYPVFLRRERGHGRPLSDLLGDWDEVRRAADRAVSAGVPESALLIVEFAAEPVLPGLYRRLSTWRVGERLVAAPIVHHDDWLVKYGKLGCATPALYEEELRIVRDNPYEGVVRRAFEIAGIGYGRADYGLVGGLPQIYEINTNPKVAPGGAHPSPLRIGSQRLAWERYLAALHEFDAPAARGRVALRGRRLRAHRAPWPFWPRTRRAP
jgi:hypothetical protein